VNSILELQLNLKWFCSFLPPNNYFLMKLKTHYFSTLKLCIQYIKLRLIATSFIILLNSNSISISGYSRSQFEIMYWLDSHQLTCSASKSELKFFVCLSKKKLLREPSTWVLHKSTAWSGTTSPSTSPQLSETSIPGKQLIKPNFNIYWSIKQSLIIINPDGRYVCVAGN